MNDVTQGVIDEYAEELTDITVDEGIDMTPEDAEEYVRYVACDYLSPDEVRAVKAELDTVDWQAVIDVVNAPIDQEEE